VPVIMSAASSAFVAVQLPVQPANRAVPSVVAPLAKATMPLGVPEVDATVAEYLTIDPKVTEVGETDTDVVASGSGSA
jgi:hypothetical protein